MRRLALVLAGSMMLCACGRVGMLEQPAPLYGAKAKADYAAKKAAEAEKVKTAKDSGEPEPLPPDTPAPPADSQPGAGPHGAGVRGLGSPSP